MGGEPDGQRWWLNPTLRLRWKNDGLVASVGGDEGALLIPPIMVGVLDCFKEPSDPENGVATFLNLYADDEDDPQVVSQVRSFVSQMQQAGVLVAETHGGPLDVEASSFTRASTHVNMLSDYARTTTYRQVLARHCPGKVVLEIGCGSGVLACLAAKAGARKVYAIEETEIIHVARDIAAANGLDERIVFLQGNSATVEVPEPAEVIYSEIIGSDPLAERVLPSLRDARERFLAPGGTMIPDRLSIAAVCIHSASMYREQYVFDQALRQAETLGRTYALDLDPLVQAYRAELDARQQSFALTERVADPLVLADWDQASEILTDAQLIAEFDLHVGGGISMADAAVAPDATVSVNRSLDEVLRVPLRFQARRTGVHNAMAVFFEIRLDDETVLSNSPFGVQMPLNWGGQLVRGIDETRVSAGDVVAVEAVIDPAERPTLSFQRP